MRSFRVVAILVLFSAGVWLRVAARDITFCGEVIPVNHSFVATKLMNVIRSQAAINNLPRLRRESMVYFPIIRYYLAKTGLPDDLKYLPIVESNFRYAVSKAGARGFWQLMPETAREWGLRVDEGGGAYDERDDIYKATLAACKELARNYLKIRRELGISSWVLTAAAYNYGVGNLYNTMSRHGTNYFNMKLNPETAVYVYKIIAIKELFEYPEYYIRNFQYNVFDVKKAKAPEAGNVKSKDPGGEFTDLEMDVQAKSDKAPADLGSVNIERPSKEQLAEVKDVEQYTYTLTGARLEGTYQKFKDGDTVRIRLLEELASTNQFRRAGSVITGRGWIIDDRVYVDLGFDGPEVVLYDAKSKQGIGLNEMKGNAYLILKVQD